MSDSIGRYINPFDWTTKVYPFPIFYLVEANFVVTFHREGGRERELCVCVEERGEEGTENKWIGEKKGGNKKKERGEGLGRAQASGSFSARTLRPDY